MCIAFCPLPPPKNTHKHTHASLSQKYMRNEGQGMQRNGKINLTSSLLHMFCIIIQGQAFICSDMYKKSTRKLKITRKRGLESDEHTLPPP